MLCPKDSDEAPLDDDAVRACFDELHKPRLEWAPASDAHCADLRCSLLGGAWLLKTHGREYDAFQIVAAGAQCKLWCRQYRLNQSARFSIENVGVRVASILARGWAHRMQFYFDAWKLGVREFTVNDHNENCEPTEFAQMVLTLSPDLMDRVVEIRNIRTSTVV